MIKPNTITAQVGHVVDIAPTFLDILNTKYPVEINGFETLPLHGKSLLPIFKGKQREEPEFFISGLNKFRMFRMGDWKIVRVNNEEKWELYNMINDPSETKDLSEKYPDKVQELLTAYKKVPFYNN